MKSPVLGQDGRVSDRKGSYGSDGRPFVALDGDPESPQRGAVAAQGGPHSSEFAENPISQVPRYIIARSSQRIQYHRYPGTS